jgi:murein DD-endopeptidase MepM/ murein hydrolase activator NlpD
VHLGQSVSTGMRVGRVGASGEATGPHLHFEVRVRGAAVDPVPALR